MKAILLLILCIAVVTESSDDRVLYSMYYDKCYSDSDCWDDYCCINTHPEKDGFCRPLARAGEGCSEFHMCTREPSDYFCPCRGSLFCERNPHDRFPRNTCQVNKTVHLQRSITIEFP